MSPRRSSRARSSQQPLPAPTHTNSSTSTSSKADRDTRTSHRANSPRISSTHRSESADGADSTSRLDQMAPRRSRRNGEEKGTAHQQTEHHEHHEHHAHHDIEATDEEVTRCICGQAEYPGPSLALRQQQPNVEAVTDETGNFFVQCDNCGVWQHGGCMGLLDESLLPDEYYCELCKPEFHKITRSSNGPKSSQYVPIPEPTSNRSSPLSSTADMPRKKDSKSKAQSESTKRRATMNSRGAYDEDEMLRRAIEESRETLTLGKRTRDDSEDNKGDLKRRRTGSNSSGTVSRHSGSPEPTLDEAIDPNRTASSKLRGAAARNNREKELRDQQKEQQAAIRAEAANKRNARSERRRVEDSPPPTPTVSPFKPASTTGKQKAETPPSSRSQTTTTRKPGGRPPARRGRLGRNQYTRDTTNGDDGQDHAGLQEVNGAGSPIASGAETNTKDSNHKSSAGHNGINGESGRSSKAKTHPARTSLNEMKRRVAAILEFVGRMQTERTSSQQAGASRGSSNGSKGTNTPNGASEPSSGAGSAGAGGAVTTASLVKAVEEGLKDAKEKHALSTTSTSSDDSLGGNLGISIVDEREFTGMGSVDMMETLSKELVQWQSVYGVYSR